VRLADKVIELLAERLGLLPELLGIDVVERALATVFGKPVDDTRLLDPDHEEWQRLVDELTVQETWFFRDVEPFRLLAAHVREKSRQEDPARPFRVLCVPCATGEEPYSVAMTLLDTGLTPDRIRIDAADISGAALRRAQLGVYGKTSFRAPSDSVCARRYFEPCGEEVRVQPEVAQLVHFEQANLLDLSAYRQRGPYDAVFCRNALIYLTDEARRRAITGLHVLLRDDGLLFTGHSEVMIFLEAGYARVDHERGFACRKLKQAGESACATPGIPPVGLPARRPRRRARPSPGGASPEVAPAASLERAGELANRGDLAAAAAICERLVAQGTQDATAYALLGVISQTNGKFEPAEELFRTALYLDPHHYESLLHMSLLCDRRGDPDGCRRYRARAGRALARQQSRGVTENA
jgi:chemotaxis protein methyltransferase WspC